MEGPGPCGRPAGTRPHPPPARLARRGAALPSGALLATGPPGPAPGECVVAVVGLGKGCPGLRSDRWCSWTLVISIIIARLKCAAFLRVRNGGPGKLVNTDCVIKCE